MADEDIITTTDATTIDGVVVLDLDDFRAAYPEFDSASDAQLENYFKLACLYLDNTPRSLVKDAEERETLLWLLMAHLTALYQRGMSTIGTASSATEGSVSASFSTPDWGNAKWYAQTQYGLMFWQATMKYRLGGHYYAYCKS